MKYLLDIQKGMEIVSTKKVRSFVDLKNLVLCFMKEGIVCEDATKIINSDYEILFDLKSIPLYQIISLIYCKFKDEIDELRDFEDVNIYEEEYLFLKEISDLTERKILYTFLVLSKYNDHPSGWIRYEKDFIFDLWGLKVNGAKKVELLNTCCKDGLDLSVIGGKNPIACFKVRFRTIQDKPFIKINKFCDLKKIYFELFGE